MSKGEYLGEFEVVVLLAVARCGADAYGMTIRQEVQRTTARDVSVPAVYVTLSRLLTKGLVSTHLGDGTPKRGGRPKKYFTLEPAGAEALRKSKTMFDALWDGVRLDSYLG